MGILWDWMSCLRGNFYVFIKEWGINGLDMWVFFGKVGLIEEGLKINFYICV